MLDAYCKPESWSHRILFWEGPNLSGSHSALLAWHYLAAEAVRRRVTLCWRAWTKIPKTLRSMAPPSSLNLTGRLMARQCALLSFSSSLPASLGKPDPWSSSCVNLCPYQLDWQSCFPCTRESCRSTISQALHDDLWNWPLRAITQGTKPHSPVASRLPYAEAQVVSAVSGQRTYSPCISTLFQCQPIRQG